jgi:type IV fimbrial biogenesis protein FimT
MTRSKFSEGLSLVELLATLSIVGILLTLGMPSLARFAAEAELRAQSSALSVALARARLRAVETASIVTVCPSTNATVCQPGTDWSSGWLVFDDGPRAGQPGPARGVLEAALLDPDRLLLSSTSGRRTIRFRADGTSAGSNVTMTLCDPRHPGLGRQLVINNIGRVRSGPLPPGWTCRLRS